jgi:hypothetical protein
MKSVLVTVNGTTYTYECHTNERALEILNGTLAVMRDGDTLNSFVTV